MESAHDYLKFERVCLLIIEFAMVTGDEGGPVSQLISSSLLLRPLLFRTVVVFFFLLLNVTFFSGSVDLKSRFRFLLLSSETAPEVFRSYPRRLDCLTICGHQGKGNAFSVDVLRPRELVPPAGNGLQPEIPVSTLAGTNPVTCVLYSSPKINDGPCVIND